MSKDWNLDRHRDSITIWSTDWAYETRIYHFKIMDLYNFSQSEAAPSQEETHNCNLKCSLVWRRVWMELLAHYWKKYNMKIIHPGILHDHGFLTENNFCNFLLFTECLTVWWNYWLRLHFTCLYAYLAKVSVRSFVQP